MQTVLYIYIILGMVIGGYLYFLPGIIAGYRKHKHRTAITLLDLIIGWTVIGWIGLLIWALTGDENKTDYTKQLLNLSKIKEKGLITDDEFNREKNKILNIHDDDTNNQNNPANNNETVGCYGLIFIIVIILTIIIGFAQSFAKGG